MESSFPPPNSPLLQLKEEPPSIQSPPTTIFPLPIFSPPQNSFGMAKPSPVLPRIFPYQPWASHAFGNFDGLTSIPLHLLHLLTEDTTLKNTQGHVQVDSSLPFLLPFFLFHRFHGYQHQHFPPPLHHLPHHRPLHQLFSHSFFPFNPLDRISIFPSLFSRCRADVGGDDNDDVQLFPTSSPSTATFLSSDNDHQHFQQQDCFLNSHLHHITPFHLPQSNQNHLSFHPSSKPPHFPNKSSPQIKTSPSSPPFITTNGTLFPPQQKLMTPPDVSRNPNSDSTRLEASLQAHPSQSPLSVNMATIQQKNLGLASDAGFKNQNLAAATPSLLYCLVCGDRASGRHYGVLSCDGCRGFFKRSVRRNMRYSCKSSNRCVVDAARRNQCQACRFSRCLTVKMNRDAVQHERAPRNVSYPMSDAKTNKQESQSIIEDDPSFERKRTKRKRTCNPMSPIYTDQSKQEELDQSNCSANEYKQFMNETKNAVTSTKTSEGFNSLKPRSIEDDDNDTNFSHVMTNGSPFPVSSSPQCIVCLQKGCHQHFHHLRREECQNGHLENMAAKILLCSVTWARSLPSLSSIESRDQAILLEISYPRLIVLGSMQWCPAFLHAVIKNLSDRRQIENETEPEVSFTIETIETTLRMIGNLDIDSTEFACLKAISIFSPDQSAPPAQHLMDRTKIDIIRNEMILTLAEHIATNHHHYHHHRHHHHNYHHQSRLNILQDVLQRIAKLDARIFGMAISRDFRGL